MSPPVAEFRTLIADPSTHMAGLVTLMLRSLKLRAIDEVSDAEHAATVLSQRPYSLVLIDEQLGGESDFGMIRTLRQTVDHPNRLVPIIMMAATPDAAMIIAARDAGVTEFLRKPFSAHHIELRLEVIQAAPREFVEAASYAGPDRRRRDIPGTPQRRAVDGSTKKSA